VDVVPAHIALHDLQRPRPRRPRPHAASLDEVLQLRRRKGGKKKRGGTEKKMIEKLMESVKRKRNIEGPNNVVIRMI